MKIWIVSFGGVCCSHILQKLQQEPQLQTNSHGDGDGIKHLHSPKSFKYSQTIDKFDKIIYIYNDPLLAILSHFRRKWVYVQHKKILNPPLLNESLCKNYERFENHTIKNGTDMFGCRSHFDEWYRFEHEKPILFVDPRTTNFENQIQTFLGVPVKFNLKLRNSNKSKCKHDMISIYDEIDKYICTKIQALNER